MNKNNYRTPIIAAITGVLLIIILSVIYVLTDGGNSKSKTSPTASPSPDLSATPEITMPVADDSETYYMNAVIKGIDVDNAFITAEERGTGNEYDFTYSGRTDIRTAYGKLIPATLLHPGDFVVLAYDGENRLKSVTGSKDIAIYKNVLQRVQEDSLKRITIQDEVYRYGDDLLVLNDGYFVGLDTLRNVDVISLYSVDNYIYLIKVEKGHGYFRLANYSSFIGGVLSIGKYQSYEITDDLDLTLAEGDYDITVESEGFKGEASIRIDRDMTTQLDLGPYAPVTPATGFCLFDISPAGAALFIDGVRTLYDSAVEMTQGDHWIEVSADGYTSYTGFIKAGDGIDSLNISLSPAPYDVADIMYEEPSDDGNGNSDLIPPDDNDDPDDTGIVDSTSEISASPTPSPTEEPPDDTDDITPVDETTPTATPAGEDSNNVMVIKCSDGAAVYLDDAYKGTIADGSLTLKKVPGDHTIRFTKEGYLTKRYTVFVEDDGLDAEFSFPEMVR